LFIGRRRVISLVENFKNSVIILLKYRQATEAEETV
jgi:hypothetical protein